MPFIALLGGWRNVAIAAAVAVALLYIGALKWSIARLERDLAVTTSNLETARENVRQANRVNAGNLATLAKLRTDRDAGERAQGDLLAAAEARCTALVKIKKEVTRVATEHPATCPTAASVLAAFDGLRATAGARNRDPDRAGRGEAAGGAADVP